MKTAFRWLVLLHASVWILWILAVFTGAVSVSERDWFLLREVAKSFVAGDWQSIYVDREVSSGTLFFRYPPFVLYLIAPFAVLPPIAAYALVCVVQLAASAAVLYLLFRIRTPTDPDLNVACVFASAAMAHVIVSGQNSAILALVIAAAAYFWAFGHELLAAACVGLLACKPNWLPFFVVFALWRGGLRAGGALALTWALLVLSTIPLGLDLWRAFYAVTTRTGEIAVRYPAYKEITLYAALSSATGWGTAAKIGWTLASGVLVMLAFRALRQERPIGRSIALITLLALVLNPYAHFYDGFVLTVPGTLWYAHREAYSEKARRIIAVCIAAYWLWDMTIFYYGALIPGFHEPSLSVGGIILTVWLISEAVARADNMGSSRPAWANPEAA